MTPGRSYDPLPAELQELTNPDWLLAGFDPAHDVYQFARVSRATYRDSAFLDHRIQPRPDAVRSAGGAEIDRMLAAVAPSPAAWIFHTAFCGSTLLASCLDHEGRTLVLREPGVLSRLAAHTRAPADTVPPARKRRVLALVERRYEDEAVVIKPSNYANALLADVLARNDAPRRCLLLGSGLKGLLLSVLKKRTEAEQLLGGFTEALLGDSDYRRRVRLPPLGKLSLLQQGVVFWHCQRHHFARIRAGTGGGSTMGMTLERFLAEPAATLTQISAFFGLGLDEEAILATVDTGAFRRHAKTGSRYGPEQRRREADALAARHRDELDAARAWARPLLEALPPEPLVAGEEPLGF